MATIFDEEKWTSARAALQIFWDSRTDPTDEQGRQLSSKVTAWFADPVHNGFPIEDDAIHKKFKTFADRARKLWGDEFAHLELHPGLWTWFVAAKCWRSSSKTFWRDFHQWLDGNTADGRLLLIQQRSGSTKTWAKPILRSGKANLDFGVQPATLVFRPFSKPMVSAVWRTVVYKLGGKASEPKTTTSEMDTAGYTSRSHGWATWTPGASTRCTSPKKKRTEPRLLQLPSNAKVNGSPRRRWRPTGALPSESCSTAGLRRSSSPKIERMARGWAAKTPAPTPEHSSSAGCLSPSAKWKPSQ
jgi:hypothetical protein